jgi:hypothetical protein
MYYNEIKYTLYIHILVHLSLLSAECQVQLQRQYTVSCSDVGILLFRPPNLATRGASQVGWSAET